MITRSSFHCSLFLLLPPPLPSSPYSFFFFSHFLFLRFPLLLHLHLHPLLSLLRFLLLLHFRLHLLLSLLRFLLLLHLHLLLSLLHLLLSLLHLLLLLHIHLLLSPSLSSPPTPPPSSLSPSLSGATLGSMKSPAPVFHHCSHYSPQMSYHPQLSCLSIALLIYSKSSPEIPHSEIFKGVLKPHFVELNSGSLAQTDRPQNQDSHSTPSIPCRHTLCPHILCPHTLCPRPTLSPTTLLRKRSLLQEEIKGKNGPLRHPMHLIGTYCYCCETFIHHIVQCGNDSESSVV
jgi:hypothetical protein